MDDHGPVQDDEFVYRRIHCQFFDSGMALPIRREAFRPNQSAYQADKARWKPVLFELAKLASAAIVHQPR